MTAEQHASEPNQLCPMQQNANHGRSRRVIVVLIAFTSLTLGACASMQAKAWERELAEETYIKLYEGPSLPRHQTAQIFNVEYLSSRIPMKYRIVGVDTESSDVIRAAAGISVLPGRHLFYFECKTDTVTMISPTAGQHIKRTVHAQEALPLAQGHYYSVDCECQSPRACTGVLVDEGYFQHENAK